MGVFECCASGQEQIVCPWVAAEDCDDGAVRAAGIAGTSDDGVAVVLRLAEEYVHVLAHVRGHGDVLRARDSRPGTSS